MALYVSLTCYGKHRPFPQDTSALRHALSPKGLTHSMTNSTRGGERRGARQQHITRRSTHYIANIVELPVLCCKLSSRTLWGYRTTSQAKLWCPPIKQHITYLFAFRFRKFWTLTQKSQKSHTPSRIQSIGDQPSTHASLVHLFSLGSHTLDPLSKACPPVGRA